MGWITPVDFSFAPSCIFGPLASQLVLDDLGLLLPQVWQGKAVAKTTGEIGPHASYHPVGPSFFTEESGGLQSASDSALS